VGSGHCAGGGNSCFSLNVEPFKRQLMTKQKIPRYFGLISQLVAWGTVGRENTVLNAGSRDSGSRVFRIEEKQAVTPTNDRKYRELHAAFVIMAIVATAGVMLTTGLARIGERMAPQIGDIIAFPGTQVPSVNPATFAARRAVAPDSMSCILDVRTMQKLGGSLMVETSQFKPSRIFRVHWAGVRTSSSEADCGSSADLLLDTNQVAALVFAAGGKGVKAQK
jgi:hypothetical protein